MQKYEDDRIKIWIGDQADPKVLSVVCNAAGRPFDLIIDDGSHFVADVIASFEYLFGRVEAGGLYVIEDVHVAEEKDWGAVAYNKGMDVVNHPVGDNKEEFDAFMKRVASHPQVEQIQIYDEKICFIGKRMASSL